MIAVLLFLALGLGTSLVSADSSEPTGFGPQASVEHAEPGSCANCGGEAEAMSASSCFVGCIGVPAGVESGMAIEAKAGSLHILPDQRFGRADSSPEPHPPRQNILA